MIVVDTNGKKIQQKFGMTCLRIDDDQGRRRKTVMKDTKESRKKNSFFESIPEKIRL
jgi:predicted transcriptional regulator